VPTRELAIQVAEAFQRYATHLKGFHVLPIYGGQSYTPQLQSLKRGVHVVVGTPGRIMDHLKRETLKLSTLKYLVLDEADEMLRMGFIADVEWILEQAPKERHIALFSATMPPEVRRIAKRHLSDPAEVTIKSKTSTAGKIRQRYWMVSGMHKLDALTRILEAEPFDGMLIFTRTKVSTEELAERLEARGFAVEALNGDIAQAQRERTVGRLKNGQIDIVVATDVAARGLDVERISHVVNFDVPYDPESYIHRIGRTGRAGRSGDAILFIAPRERNMLRVIERATRQSIAQMELPTVEDVNQKRVAKFTARISAALEAGEGVQFRPLIERFESEHNIPAVEVAAALASLLQGKKTLFMQQSESQRSEREPRRESRPEPRTESRAEPARERPAHKEPPHRKERESTEAHAPRTEHKHREERAPRAEHPYDPELARSDFRGRDERPRDTEEMETWRVEVGREHGVEPGNLVGAIANEAKITGKRIGRIKIQDNHSFIDLPAGMPKEVFFKLQKVVVGGQPLQISRALKTHAKKLQRDDRPPPRKHRKGQPR
jgi:ATP-dependent RNA helicase DeaD